MTASRRQVHKTTEYTLSHMGLDPTQRARISTHEYEAGHMMYIHVPSLVRMKQDLAGFVQGAVTVQP